MKTETTHTQIIALDYDSLENVTGGVLSDEDYARAMNYINELYNSDPLHAEFLSQQLGGYHSTTHEYTYDEFLRHANKTYKLILSRNSKKRPIDALQKVGTTY